MPSFNSSKFIGETIESIIHQSHSNWELIIIDDGSEDNTVKIIQKFISNESRIKLIQRNINPKGAPTCRNIGIENSNGNYIIFLDSDDILANWCLESRLKHFKENKNCHFLVFQTLIFHSTLLDSKILWNKLKGDHDLERFSKSDNIWQTSSVIWKKEALIKLNYWDVSLKCWQDWELHLRALIRAFSYKKIDAIPDSFYRKPERPNENSISNQKNLSEYWNNVAYAVIKISNISPKNIKINLASIIFKHSMVLMVNKETFNGFKYITYLSKINLKYFFICFTHLLIKFIIIKLVGIDSKLFNSRLLLSKDLIETNSTYLKVNLNERDFNELKSKISD